jgi:hypothetical protein
MIFRTVACIAACCVVAACGKPNGNQQSGTDQSSAPASSDDATIYKGFQVSAALDLNPDDLPPDNDLKMAGDITEFAADLCQINIPGSDTISRCDVFARPITSGSLGGYLAIVQRLDGVTLNSSLSLAHQAEQRCAVEGKLWSSEHGGYLSSDLAGSDFSARIAYSAWEVEPGDWRVAFDDGAESDDTPSDRASGVWYLDRKGNNLRLQRERWSYCYTDTSAPVDDVYRRILTFERP